jgi:hypothetical protein
MEMIMRTKAKILTLLEGPSEENFAKIYQFIKDLHELDYIDFLCPINHEFPDDLEERAPEAVEMLENIRDIEGTLRDLEQGKIKIQ